MPILERQAPTPERNAKYKGPCFVYTLESIFGELLGKRVVAPKQVYLFREAFVETYLETMRAERKRVLGVNNLWGAIGGESAASSIDRLFSELIRMDPLFITDQLLPFWSRTDPDLTSLIDSLSFDFVNAPFYELVRFAREGNQVGVVITCYRGVHQPEGHIFHLSAPVNRLMLEDLSDAGDLRGFFQKLINNNEITDWVESARKSAGFSGLLVYPKC